MANLGEMIRQFRSRDPKVSINLNPGQSAIRTMRGRIADPVNLAALHNTPFEKAREFIREHKSIFGGIDEATDLIEKRSITTRRDMTHVIFQQQHGRALVLGSTLTFHYGANGEIYHVDSTLAEEIDAPKTAEVAAKKL